MNLLLLEALLPILFVSVGSFRSVAVEGVDVPSILTYNHKRNDEYCINFELKVNWNVMNVNEIER
jgi:hypothetical protein